MKKTWIAVLALMMALIVLCAACSGSKPAPEPTEAPQQEAEATELPTVTAPPKDAQAGNAGVVGANANGDAGVSAGMSREDWLASISEEQRKVEEELIGSTVEELYAAIGQPKDAVYGASCLVAGGEDGTLTYDGFTVSTTRSGGQEIVMGTAN